MLGVGLSRRVRLSKGAEGGLHCTKPNFHEDVAGAQGMSPSPQKKTSRMGLSGHEPFLIEFAAKQDI